MQQTFVRVLVGAIVVLALGIVFTLNSHRTPEPIDASPNSDMNAFLDKSQMCLLAADRTCLRKICTEECWKRMNDEYDFYLSHKPYQGDFSHYLRRFGDAIEKGRRSDFETLSLATGERVFYFSDEYVYEITITIAETEGGFRIVDLSLGRINPESISEALHGNEN